MRSLEITSTLPAPPAPSLTGRGEVVSADQPDLPAGKK